MDSLPSPTPTIRARVMELRSLAFDSEGPSLKEGAEVAPPQTQSSYTNGKGAEECLHSNCSMPCNLTG